MVAAGREAQLHGVLLDALLERLGVELAGAVVEQRGGQVRHARLDLGILVGAADEGEVHRDQRDGRIAHQPRLDAAGRLHHLDLGGLRRARAAAPARTGARAGNEYVGSAWSRALFLASGFVLDQIAGHRAALVEPGARRACTSRRAPRESGQARC
jgi:hypothetical protein